MKKIDVHIGQYNAKGTVWFDGLQLEKLDKAAKDHSSSSFNSVENSSSFQDGLEHWS